MGGWFRRALPKHWASGQSERDQTSPPTNSLETLLYTPAAGGHGPTPMHIYMCTSRAFSNLGAHTNLAGLIWAQPFWHWFVFLILPPYPSFFISHSASLVRLPVDTSQSNSPGLGSGAGLGGGLWGGIFGEMERRARRKGGEEGGAGTITWQLTMECPALLPCVPACTQISSCQNQYASFPIFTHHVDRRLSP